ncbi:MAG: hypothetical protein ACHRHE_17790 [Tepidisphaerales bacterium]
MRVGAFLQYTLYKLARRDSIARDQKLLVCLAKNADATAVDGHERLSLLRDLPAEVANPFAISGGVLGGIRATVLGFATPLESNNTPENLYPSLHFHFLKVNMGNILSDNNVGPIIAASLRTTTDDDLSGSHMRTDRACIPRFDSVITGRRWGVPAWDGRMAFQTG